MAEPTTVAVGEQRLHRRILVALGLVGLLVALGFSQRGAMFTPPAAIAASAQMNVPDALSVLPGDPVATFGGGVVPRGAPVGRATTPGAGAPSVGTTPGVAPFTGTGGPASEPAQPAPTESALPETTDSFTQPTGSPQTGGGSPTINSPGDGNSPGAVVTPNPTTPVPEPATWLILMVGIGIIGGALRRRRIPGSVRSAGAYSAA